jgi:anti-sigma B factor antagonist
MPEMTIDVRDDLAVVTPPGDVDLETTADLRAALIGVLLREAVSHVVVDLRRADFLDSTGIGVLVAAYRAGERRGVTVRVANAGPLVTSVLTIVGLYATLTAPVEPAAPPDAGPHVPAYERRPTNVGSDGSI